MSTFVRGYEFDAMSRRPMYATCPTWLVEHCAIGARSVVVDLGCGSGLLTEVLLERFRASPEFRVIAVDPSEYELDIARARITDPRVTFVHGTARDAAQSLDTRADAVLACNVLHQIRRAERADFLASARDLVRPGGSVGANTLFYDGAVPAETRPFYLRWMVETRAELERVSVRWTAPAQTPVALELLTARQHEGMLQSLGCEDIVVEEIPFEWRVEDWEALCRYSVFVRGIVPLEIDLTLASQALIAAVGTTYSALGIDTVLRNWLHCVARRPTE